MRPRALSPPISESGVDISGTLAAADVDPELEDGALEHPNGAPDPAIPDLDIAGASDDDDEFIALAQASSNRKTSNVKGRSFKKGGGFQAMGLNANLLKAITRKGFSVPTPIQRKSIPLIMSGLDVVGMARTGSGKTAAFVVPMIERLKTHSAKVGARALILSPSRELALQTLKVVKELGRGAELKSVLLVGGDSLEDQFSFMASNPDVIIATPGRFLHLQVEMSLDLSSIQYVVFDEADRLFEMGFSAQLNEILKALPQTRQTLLFSATLPKSLVEFAKAGLQEPTLVRLDAESKVSPDLQSAFFSVKNVEKDGALLHILQDVACVPTGETEAFRKAKEANASAGKKRKRGDGASANANETPAERSTIIFAATKYHVDHIVCLLRLAGYSVSFVYGALDQVARKIQVQDFRSGMTNILVVTDVAARGIDIPILANVVNYSFPSQPKMFIHRVGRTARAGQRGWSYSLVRNSDVPYLLDLQLFLSRRLMVGRSATQAFSFAEDIVVGTLPRDKVSAHLEWVGKLAEEDEGLQNLRTVSARAERQYVRTRNSASSESAKRARFVVLQDSWNELHPLFEDKGRSTDVEREQMLARIGGFRPQETIFEIGKKGDQSITTAVIKKRRHQINEKRQGQGQRLPNGNNQQRATSERPSSNGRRTSHGDSDDESLVDADMSAASDSELEVTFSNQGSTSRPRAATGRDTSVYMGYTPRDANPTEDRGYSLQAADSFATAARSATFDLNPDEPQSGFGEASRKGVRWDKRSKKYVPRTEDEKGAKRGDAKKMIRSEGGGMVPASFRSGRFDAWKKAKKVGRLPRVGEAERIPGALSGPGRRPSVMGKKFVHKSERAPKAPDKYRDDYHKRKKKLMEAKEKGMGQHKDSRGKDELRSADAVRKERQAKTKRREKSNRPSKKRKR